MSRSTSPPSSSEREPRQGRGGSSQASVREDAIGGERGEEGGVVGIEWVLGC